MFTLITTVPFKSVSERVVGPFAVGVGVAVFSIVPTALAAIVLYAPLHGFLTSLPKLAVLGLAAVGVGILVWAAIRLPQMYGDAGWTGAFWAWCGSTLAAFCVVNILLARSGS
jgi:hypothetical protein